MSTLRKYIQFHNSTEFPVHITAFVNNSSSSQTIRIGPNENKLLHSSVGEWHIDSMLSLESDRELWRNAGLGKHLIVGKFRSDPCASGNYSWMEYDKPFECIYTETDDEVKGLITMKKIN